jgi:hypothetical protein
MVTSPANFLAGLVLFATLLKSILPEGNSL